MADLVLGLAKSAVEGTLRTAKSAIEEETKLKKGVQRDLMLISDEFEMMHAFLNFSKECGTDDMTSTLVKQVRNMALDVEDCIESVVHLDNKSSWWRRFLPSCIPAAAPAAGLDDAVAGIELLKARVEAMGQRNMRYMRIGESSSNPTEQTHQQTVCDTTMFDILTEMKDVVKNQHDTMDLVKLVNKKYDVLHRQVISVWGTGGYLGMISIIREAYEDPETCLNFTCRAWVKVPHPFNPYEFLWTLLTQFYTNYCLQQGSSVDVLKKTMEVMSMTEAELIKEFMTKFGSQRYLVVLEDVSNLVEWDTIRACLPDTDSNNGSCIVLHTPQLEIASLCSGLSHRVSKLKQFSDDHFVCAFFKEDGENGEESVKTKDAQVWLDKHQLVGREFDIGTLRLKVDHQNVVPVWGIAGAGKSYLIRHLYYKKVLEGGYEMAGWVNVSHPFNLRDLSRSLLLDLQSESLQYGSLLRIKDPIQECCMLLKEHKCLVVIDGLQSTKEWDLIKSDLTFGASGSHLIVITREESVSTYCATEKEMVCNVQGLTAEQALALFKKKVSEKTGRSDLTTEETKQAKLILHKCGGLPKMIVAIAEFLASRAWEMMMGHRFMLVLETHEDFHSLQGLLSWMHSYFRTCSDCLKPCIFYLSIFPMSHIIRRRRLVRRWIVEAYSRDTKESNAEETAEEFFSKLIMLSVIQLLKGTPNAAVRHLQMRMPCCQVNGFFREYIMSRSMEENLVFALDGRCRRNPQHTGRHLAIRSTWDRRDRIVFESIDFSRIRSLTVFGEWRSFFISDKMRLLRVLDLEDAKGVTDGDLKQMLKLLLRLKFLSLRGCKTITRLPGSLGGLRQLETLDVRHTSVVTLPPAIVRLPKLQYVRAGTTMPFGHDDGMAAIASPAEEDPSASLPAEVTTMPSSHDAGMVASPAEEDPPASLPAEVTNMPSGNPSAREVTTMASGHDGGMVARPTEEADMASGHDDGMVASPAEEDPSASLPAEVPSAQSLRSRLLSSVCCLSNSKFFRRRPADAGAVEVPRGIGKLLDLQTLGVVNISSIAIVEELKNLSQLQKLGVSGINRKNSQELCSAISVHGHLESLSVWFDKGDQDDCLDGISPPPENLRSLKLYGLVSKLPVWIQKHRNLTKLNLQMTMLPQEEINVIGKLFNLRILRLCFKEFQDGKLQFRKRFNSLLVLEIACNSGLQAVKFHSGFQSGIMFGLEVLKLRCSRMSSTSLQFSGLEYLRNLKEVWLTGSYGEALKEHLQSQLAEHSKEIKPVLMEEQ